MSGLVQEGDRLPPSITEHDNKFQVSQSMSGLGETYIHPPKDWIGDLRLERREKVDFLQQSRRKFNLYQTRQPNAFFVKQSFFSA